MKVHSLLIKALQQEALSVEEGVFLYQKAQLSELTFVANEIRKKYRPSNIVTWIIDRNVNITNVCISRCQFCNFHKLINQEGTYITSLDEYSQKIAELEIYGGNQLLIQGGMHPKLGLDFYKQLFSDLKQRHPNIKLHALGPPEIAYIAQRESMSFKDVLVSLVESGMDSLPGAGAEILVDHIRKELSPGKCNSQAWIDVMHEAHKLGLTTSATMMYGHIETIEDRIIHLVKIRELQARKPANSEGFSAFIPWPFYSSNTKLAEITGKNFPINHQEYIRMIAISRIMLTNIPNIQASWLTVGIPTAQICLHSGAHDLGSIMIEENVVSQAGATYSTKKDELSQAIMNAGFTPRLRNQKYELM
jgi:cyclic dehypoxanthinyl futalosine synthase